MWETLEDLDARITALEESNSTTPEPSGNDTPSEPETPDPEPSEP